MRIGSSVAGRFVEAPVRVLSSPLYFVQPAELSEPTFLAGASDLCTLEVLDWVTMPPLCTVDKSGIDLRITDDVECPGCRDLGPTHSIRAEESLLPCSAIVDSEPDLASATNTSDVGSPRACDAKAAEIVV